MVSEKQISLAWNEGYLAYVDNRATLESNPYQKDISPELHSVWIEGHISGVDFVHDW